MLKNYKTQWLLFLLGVLIFGYGVQAEELQQIYPTETSGQKSFKTKDNVLVTFEGVFTDSCYGIAGDYHVVNRQERKIVIKNYAYYDNESMCAQMITPFSHSVQLGTLSPGHYSVWTETEEGALIEVTTLNVQKE